MPIIKNLPGGETPATLTNDRKLAITRAEIDASTNKLFRDIVATFSRNMTLVWDNPYELTPEAIFTLYGKEAAQLFAIAQSTQAFTSSLSQQLGIVDPLASATPPRPYRINGDGTVTVQ